MALEVAPLSQSPFAEMVLVKRRRHRQEIDRLDALRALRRLGPVMSVTALSQVFGGPEEQIAAELREAAHVAAQVPGFSGAGPYEIAARYYVGLIGRTQLVSELVRFPYGEPGGADGAARGVSKAFSEVKRALDEQLIDLDTYHHVLAVRTGWFGEYGDVTASVEDDDVFEVATNDGPTMIPSSWSTEVLTESGQDLFAELQELDELMAARD